MRMIVPGAFSLLTLFCAWLFYIRYWKYRDCIDAAQSSCVLPDGDNLTGGGFVWGVFAILFALAGLVAWQLSRPRR